MGFYGVEAVEDALDRTKDIILPFDFMTWTRLAVIIFFLGGTGLSSFFFNFPFSAFPVETGESYGTSTQTGFDSALTSQVPSGPEMALPTAVVGVGLAVVGLVIVSALILLYLNSLAQFVMFRGVRDKEIRIRRNIGDHYVDGAKYFLFQIGLGLAAAGIVVGWIGSFFVNPIAGLLLTLPAIILGMLVAVLSGIVHDFVLQKIIDEGTGFIESLKQVFSVVRDEWKETGVYLVARIFISYAVALMTLIVVGTVSIAFLLVFGIITGLTAILSPIAAIVPGFIGFVLWIISLLYVAVPFRTYMYSYFVEVYERFPFSD